MLVCFATGPACARNLTAESTNRIQITLTQAEREWIHAHPVVRWGFDPDWPPFSSFDQYHHAVGIDADLTRLAARRAGIQLGIVSGGSWSEVYKKATAGGVDFLSATAKSPERLREFSYTHSYGTFPVVVITRNEGPFLTTISDLEGLSISAGRDYIVTEQLQHDLPSAHFLFTDTAEDAIKMVAHRQADATVQNLAVASRAIRLDGLTNLKISGVTRYEFPLRFAVRKDAPELASILNKALATITSDEQETIYAAHLTPDIGKSRDWGMWRRRARYAAAFGTAVVVLLLLWNTALKYQMRRREKAEADLEQARKDLEGRSRELTERIGQVERLNEEMRAANYDLESFSMSVSHDLRGPLRRMSSFAELLQKQAGVFLSKPHSEWLALVVRESKHMDLIIHDLLELARLGRRELRRQRVNMNQLVKSALEDFEPQLRQRQITWNVSALPDVYGDFNLLRLAFANLLDNALKYTRQQPCAIIEINAKPAPSSNTQMTFYIKDNGTGFDMKQSKKIFEPFERLPQEGEYEGVGIGLANVKKIIQKHGGEIWCDAIPDKGATFFFTLPVTPSAETGASDGRKRADSRGATDS